MRLKTNFSVGVILSLLILLNIQIKDSSDKWSSYKLINDFYHVSLNFLIVYYIIFLSSASTIIFSINPASAYLFFKLNNSGCLYYKFKINFSLGITRSPSSAYDFNIYYIDLHKALEP